MSHKKQLPPHSLFAPSTPQPSPLDDDLRLLQALTINDRKTSLCDSLNLQSLYDRESNYFQIQSQFDLKQGLTQTKNKHKSKVILKNVKEIDNDKKVSQHRKRRIIILQKKVGDLQKEISSLRRQESHCPNCRYSWSQFCSNRIQQIIQPQEYTPDGAGHCDTKRHSRDSLQFEKIDFNMPLLNTREMQQKMWIFLGTMLIAMGSKVTDFDGTFNVFKVLKESVDGIRRQVQKCQTKLNMDFFCMKEEFQQPAPIDGVGFDPFYSGKDESGVSSFKLQGIKLESVEAYELIYQNKYNFCIKYDTLLTIMEYARQHCSIS